jgi:hypothetical protein
MGTWQEASYWHTCLVAQSAPVTGVLDLTTECQARILKSKTFVFGYFLFRGKVKLLILFCKFYDSARNIFLQYFELLGFDLRLLMLGINQSFLSFNRLLSSSNSSAKL